MKALRRIGKSSESNLIEKQCFREIVSVENFQYILRRERDRADRANSVFSLVALDLHHPPDKHSKSCLIGAIRNHMRISDSVGWLNPASIGILLVDTPCTGGHSFLDRLLIAIPDMSPVIRECHVYTYPPDATIQEGEQIHYSQLQSFPARASLSPFERTSAGDITQQDGDRASDRALNELFAHRPTLWRRLAESILAALILMLISPLMIAIMISIKINSPGPALYRQTRVGHKGRPFQCYKFRSMELNVDTGIHDDYFQYLIHSDAPMKKLDNKGDPRVFPVGRLLRASSLDELPQLFNILKGEMSLIGPRPCTPLEYSQYLPWQRHRIDTLPGLTGLWQVSGKNKTTFTEMMRLDRHYNQRASIRMDFRIILKTLPVVVDQFKEHLPHENGFSRRTLHLAHKRLIRKQPGLSILERK